MNWQAKKRTDGPGWAVNTPHGDQYATAPTQTAAVGFAAQMTGVDHLLRRVFVDAGLARQRALVAQLLDAFDLVTHTPVPVA